MYRTGTAAEPYPFQVSTRCINPVFILHVCVCSCACPPKPMYACLPILCVQRLCLHSLFSVSTGSLLPCLSCAPALQSVDEVKAIIAAARKAAGAGGPGAVVGGIETDEYIDDAMDGMVRGADIMASDVGS